MDGRATRSSSTRRSDPRSSSVVRASRLSPRASRRSWRARRAGGRIEAAHLVPPPRDQVEDPARARRETHLAPAAPHPGDGNLANREARAPREKENLDVEAEPIEPLQREERLRGAGAEQLEAALRVVDPAQHDDLHHPVEDAADGVAHPRLADAPRAFRLARAHQDVDAARRGVDEMSLAPVALTSMASLPTLAGLTPSASGPLFLQGGFIVRS